MGIAKPSIFWLVSLSALLFVFALVFHIAGKRSDSPTTPSKALLDWQSSGQILSTRYGKVYVRVEGAGENLLLLHGFPTSSWDFHKVVPHFAKQYRTISIDMLGFGFSDKPIHIEYSTRVQSEVITEVLAQLNVRKFHVMAYSFGSSVALDILGQTKTSKLHILSLAFLNGGLFPETNHPRLAQRLLLSPFGKWINRLFDKQTLSDNLAAIFSREYPPPKQLLDDFWYLVSLKNGNNLLYKLIGYLRDRELYADVWTQGLIAFRGPVFVIFGEQDELSGPLVIEQLKSKRSITGELIISDAGHYPQLERPDIVADYYLSVMANRR